MYMAFQKSGSRRSILFPLGRNISFTANKLWSCPTVASFSLRHFCIWLARAGDSYLDLSKFFEVNANTDSGPSVIVNTRTAITAAVKRSYERFADFDFYRNIALRVH